MATLPLRSERAAGEQFLSDAFQQQLARWNRARLAPAFREGDRDVFRVDVQSREE